MAVGYQGSMSVVGPSSSTGSVSMGTATATQAGDLLLLFVWTVAASGVATGATLDTNAMTAIPYTASDTDTEPSTIQVYWGLATDTSTDVAYTRTNNATVTYAGVLYFRSDTSATLTIGPDIITQGGSSQNTNASTSGTGTGASGEVAVDDGSPGTNSVRWGVGYFGSNTPPAAGTNSTSSANWTTDATSYGWRYCRETTAGQGARNVGFATGTTDDRACIFGSVIEVSTGPSAPTWPMVNKYIQLLSH